MISARTLVAGSLLALPSPAPSPPLKTVLLPQGEVLACSRIEACADGGISLFGCGADGDMDFDCVPFVTIEKVAH